MLGMIVEVYTSDDQLYLYEVTRSGATSSTSTTPSTADDRAGLAPDVRGPMGTTGKTQVIARPAEEDADPRRGPSRAATAGGCG